MEVVADGSGDGLAVIDPHERVRSEPREEVAAATDVGIVGEVEVGEPVEGVVVEVENLEGPQLAQGRDMPGEPVVREVEVRKVARCGDAVRDGPPHVVGRQI